MQISRHLAAPAALKEREDASNRGVVIVTYLSVQQEQPGGTVLDFKIIITEAHIRTAHIKCRCGVKSSHPVPEVFLDPKKDTYMVLVLSCPNCKNKFGLYKRVIMRLNSEYEPQSDKLLEVSLGNAEKEGYTEEQVLDILENLPSDGKPN